MESTNLGLVFDYRLGLVEVSENSFGGFFAHFAI
jgi:hypothetical protein